MSPKVIIVEPLEFYQLRLNFDNGEIRRFDATPYLEKGIFTELKNVEYFQKVRPSFGGIQWPNEQDFSPDTLYLTSQPEETMDVNFLKKFGHREWAFKMGFDILKYLYQAELEDYQNSEYSRKKQIYINHLKSPNPQSLQQSDEASEDIEKLKIRFYARMSGYLCTIYNLEEHLKKCFHETYKLKLDSVSYRKQKELRKEEVKPYLLWRHKVFAHLADVQPRDSDPEFLKSQIAYEYGGYTTYLEYDECLSLGPVRHEASPQWNHDLPKITIVLGYNNLIEHYRNWQKDFEENENLLS